MSANPGVLMTHDGRPARSLWSLDPAVTHLNHGSYGGVPTAALVARQRLMAELEANPLAWFAGERDRIVAARAELAGWLQVPVERLALVANASAGISVALQSLPLAAGDQVVTTSFGYLAVDSAVRRRADRVGAEVVQVELDPSDDAAVVEEKVWAGVSDRTAILVLDQITSATARRLPVGALCARARAAGIATLVDGAHAPLLLTDPVAEADADVWVGNFHKFATAPRGTAALVARDEIGPLLQPPVDSWSATLDFPARFDHLGSDDATAWLAAPVAVRSVEQLLGWDRVRAHAATVADWAVDHVRERLMAAFDQHGAVPLAMPVGPIRLVAMPQRADREPFPIVGFQQALASEGFAVKFTPVGGRICWRVSGHAYVTEDDIVRFADALMPVVRDWLLRP